MDGWNNEPLLVCRLLDASVVTGIDKKSGYKDHSFCIMVPAVGLEPTQL